MIRGVRKSPMEKLHKQLNEVLAFMREIKILKGL